MAKKNLKILAHLRQNARITLTQLSRKTGAPISTLFDRMRSQQCIERYTALLCFDELGFSTRASIFLKVSNGDKAKVIEHLSKHHHVNSLYRVNNGWDLQAECIFRTMRELEGFLEKLEAEHKIKSKEVHYIIEELKREAFLADPAIVELVTPEHEKKELKLY